jgi:hypothetical protein
MGWPSLKPTINPKTKSEISAYPDNVPGAYLQWRMLRRQPIKSGVLNVVLGPRGSDLAISQAYPVGNALSTILRGPSLGDESPGGAVRRSSLVTSAEEVC